MSIIPVGGDVRGSDDRRSPLRPWKQTRGERQSATSVLGGEIAMTEQVERWPACTLRVRSCKKREQKEERRKKENPEAFSPPAPSHHGGARTLCKHLELIEKCKISRRIDR